MKGEEVDDPLLRYPAYVKALEFYDHVLEDTDLLIRDLRGEIVAKQMVRGSGSISANFEEGYGQGTTPEFIHALRIANGKARKTKAGTADRNVFSPQDLIDSVHHNCHAERSEASRCHLEKRDSSSQTPLLRMTTCDVL